jgi:CHASE2 domain-containing sensor protein
LGQIVRLGQEGRILFTIPWRLPPGQARPFVQPQYGPAKPILTTISASTLLADEVPAPGGALSGAVVVIGGSFADGRDRYATPIGRMPGALVLINAVNTALSFPQGALRPAPRWLEGAVALFVILTVSFLFALFRASVAVALSLALVLAVVLLVGRLWIEAGVWLGATLPVLSIMLHRWLDLLEHSWGHRSTHFTRLRRDPERLHD